MLSMHATLRVLTHQLLRARVLVVVLCSYALAAHNNPAVKSWTPVKKGFLDLPCQFWSKMLSRFPPAESQKH